MPASTTAESAPKVLIVPRAIYSRYTRDIARANGAQIAATMRETSAAPTPGREQPPGPSSGQDKPQNRGVAHAPTPSVTPAKCLSCAAQNAALVVLPLSLQVVGVERLAREALTDTGSSTNGCDSQLSVPELRQPPLFVAAPLAASAVPHRPHSPRLRECRRPAAA